ncbi:hypothetical protein VB713_16450 [Anabaena cylindrica UHCC 0172]|uniref:hypothetical protein n=1 Tax=Anabaena cylindrica TaxID=1165 RepID=UPI002B216E44|nr:hypothetical protein [Anabaena cylindrica]MEA5552533.1 hypothetical protein [Anabaena cylindrica UHCC 0172]
MLQIQILPGAISEIIATSADTGVLTLADRYGLMAAILDESKDKEEEEALNRLLRRVIKGRIQVLDRVC